MMDSGERCSCEARVMKIDIIDMEDGKKTYVYTCGVCGNQVDVKFEVNPERW